MCLCTAYCTHSLSSVNMKSLQIDFHPSHSVCWLKIQIKSDNPTALTFRGCILQSSSLTQFIMGSLHCHPQLITWQRLVMHASLFLCSTSSIRSSCLKPILTALQCRFIMTACLFPCCQGTTSASGCDSKGLWPNINFWRPGIKNWLLGWQRSPQLNKTEYLNSSQNCTR